MKQSLKSVLVLVCICAVMSVALAVTNYYTAPIIASNQAAAASRALLEVYPDGGTFEKIDIANKGLPKTIVEVHKASNGGYVFQLKANGYAPDMVIMLGVDASGVITGVKYLSGNETPSIGGAAAKVFSETLKGNSLDTLDGVDTISKATYTTESMHNAAKDALKAVVVLEGGSADFRTEEEILQDNLKAALPSAEGEFEKHFFVEVVTGVDAIYKAKNGSGYVVVIGEVFVGVDANGAVLPECEASEEDKQTAANAVAIICATGEWIVIDPATYADMPNAHAVIAAYKTAGGNYIFNMTAAGYGIKGENHASGEYIVVQMSITPEGQIIDCITVSQKETDGAGSACADEKFYGQFDGKTEDNYTEIDAIAGATVTTDGYLQAIMRAFSYVKYFEGGNN